MPNVDLILSAFAGSSYPRKEKGILNFFRAFYDRPDGPQWPGESLPVNNRFLGLVTPHIDYRVSQLAYAHAYEPLFKASEASTYLIFGVGHHARTEWSFDERDYLTPLGKVEAHQEALQFLKERIPLPADPQAHLKEHSIEFPLIFLQALRRLRGIDRPFQFIPLLCGGLFSFLQTGELPGDDSVLFQLAEAIQALLRQSRGTVQIIVSIDGCHIGPRFRHPYRVDQSKLKECARWEEKLWEKVEETNFPAFLHYLQEDGNQRYFDGVGALALILKIFGKDFSLIRSHYEQWFEEKDTSAVTFTSGYFEKKESSA